MNYPVTGACRYLFLMVVLLTGVGGMPHSLCAQEAVPQQAGQVQTAVPSLPGMAEIVPRLAEVSAAASAELAKIETLGDLSAFAGQLQQFKQTQEELARQEQENQRSTNLNYDNLLTFRQMVEKQNRNLGLLMEGISANLSALDGINKDWGTRREFWANFKKTFTLPAKGAYGEAFKEVDKKIGEVLKKSRDAVGPLASLQKEVADLMTDNNLHIQWIQKSLAGLRGKLLIKNAPSLFSKEFYDSLDVSLLEDIRKGYAGFMQEAANGTLPGQGWIPVLQIVLAPLIGIFIRINRQRLEAAEGWRFICRHPWATGCFVSVSSLSFFYTGVPSLWRLVIWMTVAISASFMVSALLKNERSKVIFVFSLAVFSILTLKLRFISFPQPLFRIYLAVVSVLAGAGFWWVLKRRSSEAEKQRDVYSWLLRLGTATAGVALVAQCGGYEAFAAWLLYSAVMSVFVLISTYMSILLVEGGIRLLADHFPLLKGSFFQSLRKEASRRLRWLVRLTFIVFAGLYLLRIWGVSDTVGDIWNSILNLTMSIGTVHISVKMVLLAGLFFYSSILVSSLIQMFLDRQFFPSRKMERGQRELIKKLFHYSLVLIGFLLAMGAVGIELQNFAVLAGAFGIGIGFGLQNIVNNFVSGLILLFERPITVGDVVVFQDQWGTVRQIGLRSTILETFDRSEIIVPNSQLVSEPVVNWTLSNYTARCIIPVGVAYGTDIGRVIQILEGVGKGHPEVLTDPAPYALFTGFGDSSLDFELRVWVASINNRLEVKSDLGKAIALRFQEEGIEIPFPQRDLHLRSVDEKAGLQLAGKASRGRSPEKGKNRGKDEAGPEGAES
jgi:small-conductance mechanosensitive channel